MLKNKRRYKGIKQASSYFKESTELLEKIIRKNLKENTKKGYSLENIEDALIKHGYDAKTVNRVVDEYREERRFIKESNFVTVAVLLTMVLLLGIDMLFVKPI